MFPTEVKIKCSFCSTCDLIETLISSGTEGECVPIRECSYARALLTNLKVIALQKIFSSSIFNAFLETHQ